MTAILILTIVILVGVLCELAWTRGLDLEPLKQACDREWEDETDAEIVVIAANALHWRQREIEELRRLVDSLTAQSPKIEAFYGKTLPETVPVYLCNRPPSCKCRDRKSSNQMEAL